MLRKIFLWGGTLWALILLGGYLFLFPPLPRPPQIARGLPSDFAAADEEFRERVFAAYPLPLAVEELTAGLSEQGFSVDTENNFAIFEKSKFPCLLSWRIYWQAEGGSVSGLNSKYGGACL
ncbi:hypothetical protein SAMN04488056_1301 [Cohaesibacter marisflavi]|uniref:Uncharacterized protein n=1 Tax=Cohaesibacter marisflavi TaxID=655353 RepID=A0A1I5NEU8_9HYPH|nr:hypothetical protein [Cohaesibacter marisflavi]SFP20313.1 hypothetical protein SAMN04488056_1301 [Cohaesibacter marisflavi]